MAKVKIRRVWERKGLDRATIDSIFNAKRVWPSEEIRNGVLTGKDKEMCDRFSKFLDLLERRGYAYLNEWCDCMFGSSWQSPEGYMCGFVAGVRNDDLLENEGLK